MWNVQGLTAASKRETLGAVCDHYNIDLVCIQETKEEAMSEQQLQTGHRLILMQQKQATYLGLDFVIGPTLLDHVLSFAYVSDCVAFIDLSMPMRNGSITKCHVINVYGPTAEQAREDPTLVNTLYNELGSAITIPSRWQNFICGDFNSKLGKLSQEDREAGLTSVWAPMVAANITPMERH